MQDGKQATETANAGVAVPGLTRVDKDSPAAREVLTGEVRQKRMAALERFLSGPKLQISEDGRMPTAEERNGRR